MSQRVQLIQHSSCPKCRKGVDLSFVIRASDGRINCSRGLSCPHCGWRESRDRRNVPDDVAELFYTRDGKWRVILVDWKGDLGAAARALAIVAGLEIDDATAMLDQHSHARTILTGVSAVVRDAFEFLQDAGVETRVERVVD